MIPNPEQAVRLDSHYAQTRENIVYINFNGDFTYSQAKGLLEFIEQNFGKNPYYAICDIGRQGTTSPEARKLLSKWTKDKKLRASAMIGGNRIAKAFVILIGNAIRLFGKKTILINFVDDIQEAERWIEEQRRKDTGAVDSLTAP